MLATARIHADDSSDRGKVFDVFFAWDDEIEPRGKPGPPDLVYCAPHTSLPFPAPGFAAAWVRLPLLLAGGDEGDTPKAPPLRYERGDSTKDGESKWKDGGRYQTADKDKRSDQESSSSAQGLRYCPAEPGYRVPGETSTAFVPRAAIRDIPTPVPMEKGEKARSRCNEDRELHSTRSGYGRPKEAANR